MDAVILFDELSRLSADAEDLIVTVEAEDACSVHDACAELRRILCEMLDLMGPRGLRG